MTHASQHIGVLTCVLSALKAQGWDLTDQLGAAVATKPYKTVNVQDTALAFLSLDDGFNRMLSFSFISEGNNQAATDCVLIPVGASNRQVFALSCDAARRANESILNSFAVRMA
jgi:hypothetical protein